MTEDKLYKAVGCLRARVDFSSKPYALIISEKGIDYRFPISSCSKYMQSWVALRVDSEANPNKTYNLVVYPKFKHFPDRDKKPFIKFELVSFHTEQQPAWKPGEFYLSGNWQFIPVCRTPVISIFKNNFGDRLTDLKDMEEVAKRYWLKAQHLPLLWRDAVVAPFRFNPSAPKPEEGEKYPSPYFVEIKANFSPSRECFFFSSLIGMPSEDKPRHLRLFKPKDKVKGWGRSKNLYVPKPKKVNPPI